MALIKCPECGKEISDKAKACIHCGYPLAELKDAVSKEDEKRKFEKIDAQITEKMNEEKILVRKAGITLIDPQNAQQGCRTEEKSKINDLNKEKPQKKSGIKGFFLLVLIAIIAAIGLLYYVKIGQPKKIDEQKRAKYEEAKCLIYEERYEEASALLCEIKDYKDSKLLYEDCQLGVIKQHIENSMKEFLSEDLKYLQKLELTEEVQKLVDGCNWILCKEAYEEKKYELAISYFNCIIDISALEQDNDYDEILNNCAYNYAVENYENGNFDVAIIYFEKLDIKNEEIRDYIEKASFFSKLQGKWLSADGYSGLEYVGWDVTGYTGLVDYKGDPTNPTVFKSTSLHEYTIIDEKSWTFNELPCYFANDFRFVIYHEDLDLSVVYNHVDKFHDEIPEKREPKIGMTVEEVEESTWGSPEKVHKYTYAWGVKEQWCYSGYRYIYFENGIVTAISE